MFGEVGAGWRRLLVDFGVSGALGGWTGTGPQTWNVVTLKDLPRKGVTVEQADAVLSANGYVQERHKGMVRF
jgi:hypothetical protein